MDTNTKYKKATRVNCLLLLNSIQSSARRGEPINLTENSRLLANSHDQILDKPLYVNVNQFGNITTTTDGETGEQESTFTTLTKFRQHPMLDEALMDAFTKLLANQRVGVIDEVGNVLVSAIVEISENDVTYYETTDKQGKTTIRQHHSEAAKKGEVSYSIVSFKVIEAGSVGTIIKTIEQLYDSSAMKNGLYSFMRTQSPLTAFNRLKTFDYFPDNSIVSVKEGVVKQSFSKIELVDMDVLPFPDDNAGEIDAAMQELNLMVELEPVVTVNSVDSTGGGVINSNVEPVKETTKEKNKRLKEEAQKALLNKIGN
jgi:hypothetical protein